MRGAGTPDSGDNFMFELRFDFGENRKTMKCSVYFFN